MSSSLGVQQHLPPNIQALTGEKEIAGFHFPPGISLPEAEKALILKTLEDAGGNRSRAAEILGINRRTLQMKLKEYGIAKSAAEPGDMAEDERVP